MEIGQALQVARDHHESILVTLRGNGRPQLSNVLHGVDGDGVVRISSTDDRAKVVNLRRTPWGALHLNAGTFWSYVVIEGAAEVSAVAEAPSDPTVEELVALYRLLQGEHEDWDDYRAAMVRDHRVVIRLRAEHAYGQLR
jgi:PPOX class probable F420-dependent enzyme